MSEPLVHSLDHIVLRVRDLDAATEHYRLLLGRAPSWRGEHPQWGTRNSLFRLENTYVELLSAPESGHGAFALAPGEPAEGASMLAFGVADGETFRREAEERGLRPAQPQPGRGANLDTGAVREWVNVFLPRDATHGARLFAIEHRSPPQALPPAETTTVEGGAVNEAAAVHAVDHVVIRSRDGDRARRLYGDVLGIRLALDRSFPEWGARLLFFQLGAGARAVTVEIAAPVRPRDEAPSAPAAEAPNDDFFWGVSYRVADADAAKARLAASGIETSEVRDGRKPGTRVLTVKSETHGVPTLLLEPASHG
ncbi:MAG TPA: VOC family protein [Thermoanaerobaculia bacterium]|nr:VOC family protein [Thermoanaerobaculia bacterium]